MNKKDRYIRKIRRQLRLANQASKVKSIALNSAMKVIAELHERKEKT